MRGYKQVMLTSLIALTVIAPPNAELVIWTDKSLYNVGEMVQVSVSVKNKGKEPMAVARAIRTGGLDAELRYELWCGDRQYWPKFGPNSVTQFSGVLVGYEVTSSTFEYVHPGQGAPVYWFEFNKVAHTDKLGSKADPMPVVYDLVPGEYELRISYTFAGPFDMYDFTSRAKRLFDMSFKGELQAIKKFRVVASGAE